MLSCLDGRVIVEGGEYNFLQPVWTNKGAIYDPITNIWTSVNPPLGWTNIGIFSGIVLRQTESLCSAEAGQFNETAGFA